jgi:hypothetical protein
MALAFGVLIVTVVVVIAFDHGRSERQHDVRSRAVEFANAALKRFAERLAGQG